MVFCISHWGFNTSASGKCTYVNSTFSLNALSVSFKRYFEKTFLIFHKTQEMKAEVCETLPDTAFAKIFKFNQTKYMSTTKLCSTQRHITLPQ
jgi:hypothetical protein